LIFSIIYGNVNRYTLLVLWRRVCGYDEEVFLNRVYQACVVDIDMRRYETTVVHKALSHEDTRKPCLVIFRDSEVGISIQDREKTAYVFENQYRLLQPDAPQQFMATTGILNCIALIVNVPGGASLFAHLTISSVCYSMDEAIFIKRGGGALQNMVDTLKHVFGEEDPVAVKVSLVGGWKLADHGVKLKDKYYPCTPVMWTFSGVILDCVKRALPGVETDISCLNPFDGVSWADRTLQTKMQAVADGQALRVVVLNRTTGSIELQATDPTDLVETVNADLTTVRVPISVLVDTLRAQDAMITRATVFSAVWPHGCIPPPVLEEYVAVCM
jgi:hypothetical protein